MVGRPQARPAPGMQAGHEMDGRRHSEVGRRVEGAGPIELQAKARLIPATGIGAVADGQRTNGLLTIRAHIEEGGALGGADPLVQIADVIGRCQLMQFHIQHAGRMGPVHQRVDAAFRHLFHKCGQWHDDAGGAGDVVDEEQSCAGTGGGADGGQEGVAARDRHGQLDMAQAGPCALGHIAGGVGTGVVFMIGEQDLVAGSEGQGTQDAVDAVGGIGDKGQIVRRRSQEGGQFGPGLAEDHFQLIGQKTHRLTFHPFPPALLSLQHRARAGTERAMIQEGDVRVQQPGRCGHQTRARK